MEEEKKSRTEGPGETFPFCLSPDFNPKISSHNHFGIDLKLFLDRFINSGLSLVTFLELIKGRVRGEVFGYNLVTLNRSTRGRKLLSSLPFITKLVIHYKGVKLTGCVKMRGNESTDKKKKMQ